MTGEVYEYYKYKYDESSDLSKISKKWNNIPGGAPVLEQRNRYNFVDETPGPGRYDPDFNSRSQSVRAPTYVLGIKTDFGSSFSSVGGAGKNVSPFSYKQENFKKLSTHIQRPIYSFQRDRRKDLADKQWTKKESYYMYSSIGEQIMTQKPTQPIQSMPHCTREDRLKTGIFKANMERQPQSIRIPMLNF